MTRPSLVSAMMLLAGAALAQPAAQPPAAKPDQPATPAAPAQAPKAPTLKVGDRAPALIVEQFLKGDPVTDFKAGHLYVVDFWESQSLPSLRSFPLLSKLQNEHKDAVTIIGVNVGERRYNDMTLARIQGIVDRQADKMAYTAAFGGKAAAADTAYLKAADRQNLPCSFVVGKDGLLVFIGHSMFLEDSLAKIVSGTWTIEKDAPRVAQAEQGLTTLDALFAKNDGKGIVTFIESLERDFPKLATQFEDIKAQGCLLDKQYDKAYPILAKMVDRAIADKKANDLNQISWTIVDPKGGVETKDLDLALKAANACVEIDGAKEAAFLDTLARVHFWRGDLALAVETQEKAVNANRIASRDLELAAVLQEYVKALAKSK